ncbi:MAG: hypothetical protein SGILL_008257, partial [Bacillariaceae sp.]
SPTLLPTSLHMAASDDAAPKKKGKKKKAAKKKKKSTVTASAAPKKKRASKKKVTVKTQPAEDVTVVTAESTSAAPVEQADGITIVTASLKENENEDNIYDGVWYGPNPRLPDALDFDLTGGRPGAIIESFEELDKKAEIMKEIEDGTRDYPKWFDEDYGFLEQDIAAEYDNDDPDALDAETLGQYDITDLQAKFEGEWDPETEPDPNLLENQAMDDLGRKIRYIPETPKDEEGIEVMWDSYYGPSNPIDDRTKIGTDDSYIIDDETRDDAMVQPEFYDGDPEIAYNEDIINYRRSLDIIETYQDDFLPEDMPVPRRVAKWYGYPELIQYPKKNYTNNRFTALEDLTNFDEMTPFEARTRAVELARANNAEWLPNGVSQKWHQSQREPYDRIGTLVGTTRKGEIDPELKEAIQPALDILGSGAELLSIENDGTVFRFHYHGLMKNKFGMSCWTETLIRDCGVEVTGVVFETGFRRRDPAYDGGDHYYGYS